MEGLEPKHKSALIIGALVGALLGVGAVWMMIKAPAGLAEGEDPEPILPGEILDITGTAASLLNMLDSFRRRL